MNFERNSKQYLSPVGEQEKDFISPRADLIRNRKISRSQYPYLQHRHQLRTDMDSHNQSLSIDENMAKNAVRNGLDENKQNTVQFSLDPLSNQNKPKLPSKLSNKQNLQKQVLPNDDKSKEKQNNVGLVNEVRNYSATYDELQKHQSEHIQSKQSDSYFNDSKKLTTIGSLRIQNKIYANRVLISSSQDQIKASNNFKKVQFNQSTSLSNQQSSKQITNNLINSPKMTKMNSEPIHIQSQSQVQKFKRFISPFNKIVSLPSINQTNMQEIINTSKSVNDIESSLLKHISLFSANKKRQSSTRISKITNLPQSINQWMRYFNEQREDHQNGQSIKEYYAQYHIQQNIPQTISDSDRYFSIFDKQIMEGHYIEEKNNSNLIRALVDQIKGKYFIDWRVSKKGQNFQTAKQKIFNHFQYNQQILNKVNLYTNTKRYCRQNNINIEDIMPRQYHLDFDLDTITNQIIALTQQIDIFNDIKLFSNLNFFFSDMLKFDFSVLRRYKQNLFIIKPSHLYQNLGVHQIASLKELFSIIEQYYRGRTINYNRKIVDQNGEEFRQRQSTLIYSKQFLIQQHIDNQFTINGQQFTLKYFFLITTQLKGFIALDCLIYMSYSQNDNQNQQAIYSKEILISNLPNQDDLMLIEKKSIHISIIQVKYQTQCVINSCKDQLKQPDLENQFELYQIEFIIDEELNPRLVYVEGNLQFETSSKLLKEYIPYLVGMFYFYLDEALRITFMEIHNDEKSQPSEQNLSFWQQII